MTPSYMPQYMPDVPQQTPGQIFAQNAPNLVNGGSTPAPISALQGYMGSLNSVLNKPGGQAQQMMQGGAAPPPPQMAPSAGVHPGAPGGGMDPAALQNMMQIYHTLQPTGQLGVQMQAAGVGTGQGQVPGLLSRFQ